MQVLRNNRHCPARKSPFFTTIFDLSQESGKHFAAFSHESTLSLSFAHAKVLNGAQGPWVHVGELSMEKLRIGNFDNLKPQL
jgi:hypothetical protein